MGVSFESSGTQPSLTAAILVRSIALSTPERGARSLTGVGGQVGGFPESAPRTGHAGERRCC